MLPDYYTILEVSPEASLEEIKQAYRRLVRLYHPDLTAQSDDLQQIKLVNEAYACLHDPLKRMEYDILRLEIRRARLLRQYRATPQAPAEPKMTWKEGWQGFVQEFRKGLKGDA